MRTGQTPTTAPDRVASAGIGRGAAALGRRLRGESGQALPLIVGGIIVIFALAALAVDIAFDYQARHRAQVAADAAALAAANCLANSKCTSTATNGDAYTMASSYATKNGATASSISIGGGYVTVTTATKAPTVFGNYFGLNSNASQHAVAAYKTGSTASASIFGADCVNPTLPPATSSSSCTVNCATPGVTISSNGQTSITGGIATNGSVNINLGGGASIGPVEYGDAAGTNCSSSNKVTVSGGSTINGSASGSPVLEASWTGFPLTYNAVWTSSTSNRCSNSGATKDYGLGSNVSASSASSYPSSVTLSGNNAMIGSSTTPVIICANSITLSGNSMTLTNVTLVANTFSITGNNTTISPASTATSDSGQTPNVAFYSTSTSGLNFGSNNIVVNGGVLYAPMGNINVPSNNGSGALIEGNTVTITGNNIGDGPTMTFPSSVGVDTLYQ